MSAVSGGSEASGSGTTPGREERENVRISQARPDDWPAIEGLLARSRLPCSDLSVESHRIFFVARQSNQLIGVVALEHFGDSALLRSLAVEEGFRRGGVATQLVTEAEQTAQRKGVRAIYLLTTTAEGFFKKRGYERVARTLAPDAIRSTNEFRELCPDTAVCLRKNISADSPLSGGDLSNPDVRSGGK